MGRPKVKESKAQSFRLRADIGERLDGYSETSHIPKTVIVELALDDYLNKVAPVKKNMGVDFNVNQAVDQAKDFISEKTNKKSAKQATSFDGIIKEFFKDTSYDFNVFYQKLIDARESWIVPDECAADLIGWQFVKINGETFTPIQDRENSASGELEYRITPSFYNTFTAYFDTNIRPDM